ncbi:hypothetical protein ONZ45_g10663 [Pleurotus djamor]|nr:hypothetical protein ONZ45_g10663 [Pleurotus djamor]
MDDNSRPSSPEAPPQDLWLSILDSVSSSRSIPSKQILLLGQPSSGKSALASALLQKPPLEEQKDARRSDFALGYDYADVRDDADEDTIARLSVYTVPSANPAYMSLLPHFLPPRTSLQHTLVIIALDWTRPWTFIDELHVWLQWVEEWAKGDGSREVVIAREENRERLQSHLQHYTEPTTDPLPASTSVPGTVLPLAPGTFTHNLAGIPIIVTCTKADLIDEGTDPMAGGAGMSGMVKGKGGEWEERTDGLMQVLRTICLKYGAGVFYTTLLPETLQVLRQYALHLLFIPPAPAPGLTNGADIIAPLRHPFPFPHRPNTLDRDHIVIPAGWDSWGKIQVMRDGFDPKMWGEAWEQDLEGEEAQSSSSAKKMFSLLVPDQGKKPTPLPPFNSPMSEQTFLAKHYDENAKRADRDPRGAFRNPTDMAGAATGIVGPMGTSSFDLPTVERALSEMELSTSPALGASVAGERRQGRTTTANRPAGLAALSTSTAGPGRNTTSPSPLNASTPTSAQLPQHDVLQNFFQSLLRDRPGASPTKPKPNDASVVAYNKMGKWSPEYHDDVLTTKMKTLVQGAITRMKLERQDTLISSETFVAELDTGDSFTTSMVDILVRELADRHSRPTSADRRLISDKTAKSLRQLGTCPRPYRDSTAGVRHQGRRNVHLTGYLASLPDEIDLDDDEEEFENMYIGGMEGSRINSELFDAVGGPHFWAYPESRRLARSYSSVMSRSDETTPLVLPSLPSPPSLSSSRSSWQTTNAPPTTLPRHLRRVPARSRTGDFSDFTSRRRSIHRDAPSYRSEEATGEHPPNESSSTRTGSATSGARRFFPFSRTRRNEPSLTSVQSVTPPWPDDLEMLGYGTVEFNGTAGHSPPSGAWFNIPTPIASTSSQHDGAESDHLEEDAPPSNVPRLRRGTIRAPEALLARHSPPITLVNPVNVRISASQTSETEVSEHLADDAATYPTPGSTDTEIAPSTFQS